MKFTCFASLYDNRPTTHDGWAELVALISTPIITENKKAAPLYSAAVYINGAATRSNANVAYLSMAIFDLDSCTSDEVDYFVGTVLGMGLTCFYHTTHSFAAGRAEGKHKSRLMVPFHRAVFPEEWDTVWSGMDAFGRQHGITMDPACKDPSRAYYFPSAARADDCEIVENQGSPFNVEYLISIAPPQVARTSFIAPSDELLARIESSTRFQLARLLLSSFPPAIDGQGGDLATYRAACVGNDFALSKDEFWPLLLEFNARCVPPWSDADLEKKLDNAIAYATLPTGWRLAQEGETDIVAKSDIERLIAVMLKRKHSQPRGRVLRSMLAGELIVGEDPMRVLQEIAKALASAFARAGGRQIATLFKDSLDKSTHRDINLDAFTTLIQNAQEALRAEEVSRTLVEHESCSSRYLEAFGHIGLERSTRYTDAELQLYRKKTPTPAAFDHSWVVSHGSTYYFRVLDRYVGPYKDNAWIAGSHLLSPTDISFHEYSEHSQKRRSMEEIADAHGIVAKHVVLDMTAQMSYYDFDSSTVVEAPCPRRKVYAQHHPNVDAWIKRLCSGEGLLYERVLDWLASVPLIEHPTAALVLYGAPGTGKSLMSSALSRLYTTRGPTELDEMNSSFNSMVMECPIISGDEYVPTERGRPYTEFLRKLISQRELTVHRKNIPSAKLVGAIRLILSANNLNGLIDHTNSPNDDDVAALCERFLLVHVKDSTPKTFLDSLSTEDRMLMTHGTAIAEHALWLSENRQLPAGQRLLVEGFQDSVLSDSLRAGTGLRPEVIEFVAEFVSRPEMISNVRCRPVIHPGSNGNVLLLSSKVLSEHWTTVLKQRAHVPRLKPLNLALEALSVQMVEVGGRTYYEMDLVEIRKHARHLGVDLVEFDAGLLKQGLVQEFAANDIP